MTTARVAAIVAPLLLLLCGCPKVIQADGITVVEEDYLRHRSQVLRVAETELNCSQDQLTTKVLEVSVHATVERFQVDGCDKSAIFKYKFDAPQEFLRDE